jgi:WD40 repeat protein
MTISFDGKWLAVGEQDEGRLSIWDLEKREEIIRFPADVGPVFAAFSPRARLLAFSSGVAWPSPNQLHRVRLWDGDTKQIPELRLDGPCRGLAFSGDGETLATLTAGEGQITLWKVPEGTRLARHPALQARYDVGQPFAVAPDMSVAAYALWTDSIRVVDLRTGQERWRHKLSDDYVTALAISPDGKVLASGAGFAPSPIRLWDVASGNEIDALDGHRGIVFSLVFWPDGKTLASASSDQTIRLWNTDGLRPDGWKPLRTLLGHKLEVWCLALQPDNRTLLSGCKDGSVFVWDTVASPRVSSDVRLPGNLLAWSFATNGHTIFTCDQQGRVAQRRGSYLEEEPLFEIGAGVGRGSAPHGLRVYHVDK